MTDLAASHVLAAQPLPQLLPNTSTALPQPRQPATYLPTPMLSPIPAPESAGTLPADLAGLPLGGYPQVECTPLAWDEVWSQLMAAKLRFRSTLWANDRCVVVFHQSRNNVRQFALSGRELVVLQRSLQGESQKTIANDQGLSPSTIGASLKSAMLKLGFPSHRCTTPISALALSHERSYGQRPAERPPVYSVGRGDLVLAATAQVDWSRVPTLTGSELEITRLLVQGKPNSEIARVRQTSLHTVENQVASLLRKAGAKHRFDLLKLLYGGPCD
jgi:DNA-binding CsgD family transcriptional regulator